jgi:hypothetical protein
MDDDLTDYERWEYYIKDAFRELYSPELLEVIERESGIYVIEELYAAFSHGYIKGMNHDE